VLRSTGVVLRSRASVADLAKELRVSKVTLCWHVTPAGELTDQGKVLLDQK
jgi:hypothetical protein